MVVSCLCAALAPRVARATEHRYALVVGSDMGAPGEHPLRFAVADAKRVAGVLTGMGGFAPEDTILLESPSADRVRQVLARLNASIRTETRPGNGSMLLVYFSGHADALALHLGATVLPWDELRNSVSGSAAQTRVLVIDACRSGNATRVKGTRLEQPFALPEQSQPPPEGVAILSSAAAGEVAQESDELGASFFTHHLVSALAGAGDSDGDGSVTLAEAYRYAADRTIVSTAATMSGVQHPTYMYELRGRSDVVITRTDGGAELATLRLPGPAVYVIREHGSVGALALEADVPAGKSRTVRVRPGKYLVQRRASQQLLEADVALSPGQATDLTAAKYRVVSYRQLGAKGPQPVVRGYAIALDFGTGNVPVEQFGPMLRGALRVQSPPHPGRLELEVAGFRSQSRLPPADTMSGLELLVGVAWTMRWRFLEISGGPRLGTAWITESYETVTSLPRRSTFVPLVEGMARLSTHVTHDWFVFVGASLRLSYVKQQTAGDVIESRLPLQAIAVAGVEQRW